jgi:hypothetical protein
MTEGRMAEIVTESRCLGEILVKTKSPGNYARYLSHLESVCKTGAIMISRGSQEHLSFVHKSAEGLRMNYLVSVALKLGSVFALFAGMIPPLGVCRQKGISGEGVAFSFEKNITYVTVWIVLHILSSFPMAVNIIYAQKVEMTFLLANFFIFR